MVYAVLGLAFNLQEVWFIYSSRLLIGYNLQWFQQKIEGVFQDPSILMSPEPQFLFPQPHERAKHCAQLLSLCATRCGSAHVSG